VITVPRAQADRVQLASGVRLVKTRDRRQGLVYQTMCSSGVMEGQNSIVTNPVMLMQVQCCVESGVSVCDGRRESF
jgi:hypothetical protein